MKTGLVFGCYDPIHYGHIRLFRACKEKCDKLIVAVHDDNYIRNYKHREPYFWLADRVRDLRDMKTIDQVVVNHDRSRNEWAKELNVDIVFLSEEVTGRMGIDKRFQVIHMPRTRGVSSTKIRHYD
jgi:cytidyltransferase-like protein